MTFASGMKVFLYGDRLLSQQGSTLVYLLLLRVWLFSLGSFTTLEKEVKSYEVTSYFPATILKVLGDRKMTSLLAMRYIYIYMRYKLKRCR